MSLRKLPEARAFPRPQNYRSSVPGDVEARWLEAPRAEESSDNNVISILDIIGEDWWTGGGVTAKRVSAALRSIGANQDIRVQINSPGGDLFEGIAIYNLLRAHKARVTVEVLGWAASAASIIAMAGDEIRVGRGTFVMIHNAWGMVVGNRHDMADAAELFQSFDAAIADIYVARTGRKLADVQALMDKETFMDPQRAVEEGFADAIDDALGSDDPPATARAQGDDHRRIMARRQVEAALAKAGYARGNRSELLAELTSGSTRDADPKPAARDAGDFAAGVRQLIQSMKSGVSR